MSVTPGNLDSLLNTTYAAADANGLSVQTATGGLTSVAVTTTGADALGAFQGETLTVAAINDPQNSLTFTFSYGGQVLTQETLFVVGYNPNGDLLLSSDPPDLITPLLTSGSYALANASLGILSTQPIPAGTALTFTAAPPPPAPNFTVTDATTGQTTPETGTPYSGPVAGLSSEFIIPTIDQITVNSGIPNVFIVVGAQGQPNPVIAGINVSQGNGNNVLDSYANSSFLTDGSGTDQNYIDTRNLTQNMWSTMVNFHSGDNVTVWGVTQADFALDWIGDTQGATGATGLTGVFVPTSASQHEAAVTLAGFKLADLTDGKLAITYDTINGTPYASIHAA